MYILTAVVNMFNMLDWCCIVDILGILFEHKHTVVLRLGSSTLLPPSDRHQRRSNLLSPPLRRQHVELRRRISCILHLNSDS